LIKNNQNLKRSFLMNLKKITLLTSLVVSININTLKPANATTLIASVVTAASFTPATVIVGSGSGVATVGITKDDWLGTIIGGGIAAGGVLLGLADPPVGTYYSGTFTFNYDPSLMTPYLYGWLGNWGNIGDPAPPADPTTWPTDLTFYTLQAPNPGLVANIDNTIPGKQVVSFDWGANGHQETAGPINLFGTLFQLKQDVQYTYLGNSSTPLAESNFNISNASFICTPPPPATTKVTCGEDTTSYYKLTAVPEPLTIIGTLIGGITAFKMRKRFKVANKL
jgi:hypothetical protein